MFRRVEPDKFPWIGLPVPSSTDSSAEDIIRQYEELRTDEIDAGDKRYVFVELFTETGWSELLDKYDDEKRLRNRVGYIFAVLGYDKKSHRIEFFDNINADKVLLVPDKKTAELYSSYWEKELRSIEGYSEMIKSLIRRDREDLAKEISKMSIPEKILLQAIYRELGEETVEELLNHLRLEKPRAKGFMVSERYIVDMASAAPFRRYAIVDKEGRKKIIIITHIISSLSGEFIFAEEDEANEDVSKLAGLLMRSVKKLAEESKKKYKPQVSSYTALVVPVEEDVIVIALTTEPEKTPAITPEYAVAVECREKICTIYRLIPTFLLAPYAGHLYIENIKEDDSLIKAIANQFFEDNISDRAKEIAEAILRRKGEIPETIYKRVLRDYLHLYIMTVS
jgi:hypothetical protein